MGCHELNSRKGESLESYEVEKELARPKETAGYAERGGARSTKIPPGVSQEAAQFIFLVYTWVQDVAASATQGTEISNRKS